MAFNSEAGLQLAANVGALEALIHETNAGSEKGLARIAVSVVNTVKELLSQPGSGEVYVRRGIEHQASAPGEPPAVDTGKYRASWTWRPGSDNNGAYVDVGTVDERGPWLEFGTSMMDERPHLRPAVNQNVNELSKALVEEITKAQMAALSGFGKALGFSNPLGT